MCGRTIAPMKLMHRIKHMKEDFEEKGRIQLSEFLDLILWCDLYESFAPVEMEYTEGKENKLFKLVDFERLLSHHDDRIAWALNKQYLEDEWDFGRETLGSKHMFKEPPVTNEARIQQAKHHKKNYKHLKHEVGTSQKRVYRAHAGYIRDRPITAPDLEMYRPKQEEEQIVGTTAQEAYQSVRRRLKSAPSSSRSASRFEDRPQTFRYERLPTPKAVTRRDLTEVEKKMDSLKFDITTMESRYEISKEEKMDLYIPGYREKLARRPPPVPPPEPKPEPRKPVHWTDEVIEELVHPPRRMPPSHARKCDARFRGWQPVRVKKGPHYILATTKYEESDQGRMFNRLLERTFTPVRHLHRDHLYRYTRSSQVERGKGRLGEDRPITAPAWIQISEDDKKGEGESGHPCRTPSPGSGDLQVVKPEEKSSDEATQEVTDDHDQEVQKQETRVKVTIDQGLGGPYFGYRSFEEELQATDVPLTKKNVSACQLKFDDEGFQNAVQDSEIPVPHMEHSRPKIVEVGQIGKISLLEKITESQDLEDKYSQTSRTKTSEHQDGMSVASESNSSEARENVTSSPPLSIKFNRASEKPGTSTPGPMPQLDLTTHGFPCHDGRASSADVPSEDEVETPCEDRDHIASDKSKNKEITDDLEKVVVKVKVKQPEAKEEEEEEEVERIKMDTAGGCLDEHINDKHAYSGDRKIQTPAFDNKENVEKVRRKSSLRSRHCLGSPRQSPSIVFNTKYFRLVNRVQSAISEDMKLRLLTSGQC